MDLHHFKISLDRIGRPVFSVKIYQSDLLIRALADFTNFNNNKGIVLLDAIEQPALRNCFVYLLWLYMILKFKELVVEADF